ncbi:hypothetical protein TNCT_387191 [Trichonephila clavata]|uniref:Uncharacterized protein n=1 Tax=Trichonephila clavata TaxID=2740835 RepID=A0A8X6F3M7_TRICU|nr:hypothetical protein TNCT_387191 [Trichonephila clavata]
MERKQVLSNESIQRGTCLKTHVSFQGHRSNGKLQEKETQRGLGKHGNIPPLTNVGSLMWKFPVAVEMIFMFTPARNKKHSRHTYSPLHQPEKPAFSRSRHIKDLIREHCPPYGGKVVRKCVKEGKCPSPGPRLLEIHNQHPSTSGQIQ